MSAAGDRFVVAHARHTDVAVRDLRRRVELAVRRSDRAWTTFEGRDHLAAQIAAALVPFGVQTLVDYHAYVTAYAQIEGGPPPTTPLPAGQGDELRLAAVTLAAVAAAVVLRGRRRNATNAVIDRTVGVVLGGAASRIGQADKHRWERRYLVTDPGVQAYRRVTDGNPCAFCALLASRGFVYRSRRSAGDTRVLEGWHDACGCTSQAGFGPGVHNPQLDPIALRAQEIYEKATGNYSGKDKTRAFRRAWEEAGRK